MWWKECAKIYFTIRYFFTLFRLLDGTVVLAKAAPSELSAIYRNAASS